MTIGAIFGAVMTFGYNLCLASLPITIPSGFMSRWVSNMWNIPYNSMYPRYAIAVGFTWGLYLIGRWVGVTDQDVLNAVQKDHSYIKFIYLATLWTWGQLSLALAATVADSWMTVLTSIPLPN